MREVRSIQPLWVAEIASHYYELKNITLQLYEVYYTHGISPVWVLYNEVIQSRVPAMREVCSIQPLWVAEIASHYYELKNITI